VKSTLQKVQPLFCHFLGNLHKIRPRIFSAAKIFLGPLLRFAAEISTGWQHWREQEKIEICAGRFVLVALIGLQPLHLKPL
jgi:hypothetical protein